MDPDAVRRLRGRALQLPAALHRLDERRVRRGAQPRRGPPRLVRRPDRDGRLRRRQGPDLRAASSAPASTTWPTPRPSGWSARPTSSRAPAPSASPSACRASGMLGVVEDILADRAFIEQREHQRRRAVHDRRPGLARPRTSSPTRSPPRRWPAPTGSPRRPSATGCASFRPDGHRIATVAERRRGHLGRRLQGHQPPRRPVLAAGLRPGGVGRRRPRQGRRASTTWCGPCASGCAASCSSDGTATSSPRRFRDTRRMCRSSWSTATRLVPNDGRHGARRGGGGQVGPTRRHGAAGSGMRLHGHVHQLRRAR